MQYHAAQFRAARAALGLGTRELASEARMSFRTIAEIEQASEHTKAATAAAVARLVEFYEGRGITFLTGTVQGVGLRFHVD